MAPRKRNPESRWTTYLERRKKWGGRVRCVSVSVCVSVWECVRVAHTRQLRGAFRSIRTGRRSGSRRAEAGSTRGRARPATAGPGRTTASATTRRSRRRHLNRRRPKRNHRSPSCPSSLAQPHGRRHWSIPYWPIVGNGISPFRNIFLDPS